MAPNVKTNPYLTGNFAPVTDEATVEALEVSGSIPSELEGRLLRNGPNPMDAPDPATYHWFTGQGMVHGVRLRDGRAEWYRNRSVRTDIDGPSHELMNNGPNTNVIGHAGATWAIVEAGGIPVRLSYDLDSEARDDFGGTLPGPFTAHPKVDPDTGELHAVVYSPFWGEKIQYVVVDTSGRVRHHVDVPVPGLPMVHDCAITETQVILMDLPCILDVDAAMAGASLPYRWHPEYGARLGLLPRTGGADDVRWFDIDPCYIFHPLNAYDRPDGSVVFDAVRHPAMFDTEHLGPDEGATTLDRWILDPTAGTASQERLDDRYQEFPRHDERLVGKPHRYGYGAALGGGFEHGPALKHDLVDGTTEEHDYGPGRVTLEPVFVPASQAAAEDDGYVLSFVYDATTDTSDVVILHAQDFGGDPLATISLPRRVPFGFHGNWVPDTETEEA